MSPQKMMSGSRFIRILSVGIAFVLSMISVSNCGPAGQIPQPSPTSTRIIQAPGTHDHLIIFLHGINQDASLMGTQQNYAKDDVFVPLLAKLRGVYIPSDIHIFQYQDDLAFHSPCPSTTTPACISQGSVTENAFALATLIHQLHDPTGKRGNSVSTAQISINGTFDTVNLQANVSLVYNETALILQTTGPGAPADAVNNYNNAILPQSSTQEPNFATVYNLTSQGVTNGYTEAQFAQLLQQQEQSVGKITAISVVSTSPIVTDPAGITYFIEKERATKSKNSTSRTDTFTSVFVVEDGVWKFWFSHPS